MAYLWIQETAGWGVLPLLGGKIIGFRDGIGRLVGSGHGEKTAADEAVFLCRQDSGGEVWILAANGDVRVNGRELALGLRVLRDKDEIRMDGGDVCFYSDERLTQVTAFEGAGSPTCPRCRQAIARGYAVVRCPGCGVAHHQSEELPCWTGYQDEPFVTCALCDRPATLDDGAFQWTPEEL